MLLLGHHNRGSRNLLTSNPLDLAQVLLSLHHQGVDPPHSRLAGQGQDGVRLVVLNLLVPAAGARGSRSK